MKDKKTEFRIFTITQWKKEEKYLTDMHAKGWKFERVGFLGVYHFTRCEPEDVVYQLDYNEDSEKNREQYVQMFADCGWEYIQNFVGYSYFRKPAAQMTGEREEIFSDNASRADMIRRVFDGRGVALLVAFALLIVPQLVDAIRDGDTVLIALFGVLLALYIAIFAWFAWQIVRLKRDS